MAKSSKKSVTVKKSNSSSISNKKVDARVAGLVLAAILVAGLFGIIYLNRDTESSGSNQVTESSDITTDNETEESIEQQPEFSEPTQSSGGTSNSTNQSKPVVFAVTGVTVNNPEIVYNTDKLGGQHRACKVTASISANAAGSVTYRWDVYHIEYFNPPLKGEDQVVSFTSAGTKTVELPTYVSDDQRQFTLNVLSPNAITKATAKQVWCPTS